MSGGNWRGGEKKDMAIFSKAQGTDLANEAQFPFLQSSFKRSFFSLPGPGQNPFDACCLDHLEEPGTAALAVFFEPGLQVRCPANVVTAPSVLLQEVKEVHGAGHFNSSTVTRSARAVVMSKSKRPANPVKSGWLGVTSLAILPAAWITLLMRALISCSILSIASGDISFSSGDEGDDLGEQGCLLVAGYEFGILLSGLEARET